MALLTDQWNASTYKDPDRQRIYLKDIDCFPLWHEKLKDLIPPSLFYLNESQTDFKGPGSTSQRLEMDREVSRSGDLMSCLPPSMRAENLMCYIGHEGTYTPCHREMCASLGHNIMVEASSGLIERGKRTKPGSSIWFMTESKDRHIVSEYWMSTLGHDIEIEDHFAQINAWKAAPFKTYVVEQKPGDFILVPPLAAHQVWNRGTRTMKVAWNRTTVETLEMALNEALPQARMVCRDEQYKNKAIVFYSLERYSERLWEAHERNVQSPKFQQLLKDFQRLFSLYTQILLSESFSEKLTQEKNVELLPFDSNVTCSYCRCNIFNRFLTCPWCVGTLSSEEEDTYDVCMECYAMGRSCACISKLRWVEQFRWSELVEKHEHWRHQIITLRGFVNDDYQSLSVERQRLGKRTLAEICQEQLRRRPWRDITKPGAKDTVDEEVDDSEENTGRARKRRKVNKSGKWGKENGRCHICKAPDATWRLASCSFCNLSYCYGSLFRAFNIHPQNAMEKFQWMCPRCLKICSCGACRKDPSMTPFEPTCTLLGHDTRKIADPRSVETLVDFRHSNIRWLKKAGDDLSTDSRRLKQRQKDAEKEKSRQDFLNEHSIGLGTSDADVSEEMNSNPMTYEGIPVDPALELSTGGIGQFYDECGTAQTPPDSTLE